ncbi:MAG: hypothetical protein ACSLEN_04415 [Candidatus Malihini olakiniferum]
MRGVQWAYTDFCLDKEGVDLSTGRQARNRGSVSNNDSGQVLAQAMHIVVSCCLAAKAGSRSSQSGCRLHGCHPKLIAASRLEHATRVFS